MPATFWTLALLSLPSSRGLLADIRREAAQVGSTASPDQQAVQVCLSVVTVRGSVLHACLNDIHQCIYQVATPLWALARNCDHCWTHTPQMALDPRSTVCRAVDEAIRLYSPSINIRCTPAGVAHTPQCSLGYPAWADHATCRTCAKAATDRGREGA